MFLSEAEAEAALRDLRRRRDELDRVIAEHQLYLELGRRLRAPTRAAEPAVHRPATADPMSGAGIAPERPPDPARTGEDLVAFLVPALWLLLAPARAAAPAPRPA